MPAWDDIPEEREAVPAPADGGRRRATPSTSTSRSAGWSTRSSGSGYGDNTLIFYIWGDNGSSGEGQNGTISELLAQNGIPTTVDMHIAALDELGGLDVLGSPKTDNQYHAGWAWAGSTPYKGMKLLASHLGGTRNPMAVRWPAKITPDPTPRTQFHHCNDVVPTIYEVVGITPPRVVNGVPQDPIDGVSFAYTFDDPDAPGPAAHPVLRDHGQPRDLPRRLDGLRVRPAAALGARRSRPASRSGRPTTTPGSSTTSTRTGPRPTTSPPRCPRSSRR